jgi:YHS domain-containing protein
MEALLYFALWAGLFFLMMRFGCGAHVMGHGHSHHDSTPDGKKDRPHPMRWLPPKTDIDPVCGKTVQTAEAKSAVHDGTVYYFCSRDCREIFEAAPAQYVGPNAKPMPSPMEHSHG